VGGAVSVVFGDIPVAGGAVGAVPVGDGEAVLV
jgi:hypothetical protein